MLGLGVEGEQKVSEGRVRALVPNEVWDLQLFDDGFLCGFLLGFHNLFLGPRYLGVAPSFQLLVLMSDALLECFFVLELAQLVLLCHEKLHQSNLL